MVLPENGKTFCRRYLTMKTVIKVENLHKKYVISHQQKEQYATLRDTIAKHTSALA